MAPEVLMQFGTRQGLLLAIGKKYETISKLKYSKFHSYMTLVYRTIKNAMQ
jgi:hypothetical protein